MQLIFVCWLCTLLPYWTQFISSNRFFMESGWCWPQNEFQVSPPLQFFWRNLRRIGINSSLNVWWNSPVKPSGPRLLFVGKILIDSIFLLVISLFQFSISLWFSLGKFCVSRYLSISSRFPNLLVCNCSQYSLIILFISVESVLMSLLSFLTLTICFFLAYSR